MSFDPDYNPFEFPYTMPLENSTQSTSNLTPMAQTESEFVSGLQYNLENQRSATHGLFHHDEQFEHDQLYSGPQLHYSQASYHSGEYHSSQFHYEPRLTPSQTPYGPQLASSYTHVPYGHQKIDPAYSYYDHQDPNSQIPFQYGDQNTNPDPHALYGQDESTNQIYLTNGVADSYPSPSPFTRTALPYSAASNSKSSEFYVPKLEDPKTPLTTLNSTATSTLSTISTQPTPSSMINTPNQEAENDHAPSMTTPEQATMVIPRPQKREKNLNSKLQKKLATKNGPVGDNRQVMGVFRRINTDYGMWKERGSKSAARRATYHSHIRAELIALDEASNAPYDQVPAAGLAVDDVTSPNTFTSSWTSDLGSVRDRRGQQVLLMEQEPAYYGTAKPSNMIFQHPIYGQLVVIDHNNHPVRHWRDVPRVISSEIEAWRIEALQRTVGVAIPDIRARMPRACLNKNGSLYTVQGPTALTNRTARWRKKEGVVAWRRNGRRKIAQ